MIRLALGYYRAEIEAAAGCGITEALKQHVHLIELRRAYCNEVLAALVAAHDDLTRRHADVDTAVEALERRLETALSNDARRRAA